MVTQNAAGRRAIAMTPVHPQVETPYMGKLLVGCSQSIKRGLEMMSIAAIDMNRVALRPGSTNTSDQNPV
ncbi:hypothetical protein MASR1M31_06240 [Porphyromonadaceae bacterium]